MSRTERPIPGITLRKEPRGPWFGSLSLNELKARTWLRRVAGVPSRVPPAAKIPPEIQRLVDERNRIIALAETGEFNRNASPASANHVPTTKLRALFSDAEQDVLHNHSLWVQKILLPWQKRRDLLHAAKHSETGILSSDHQAAAQRVLTPRERASLERYLEKLRADKN
ncbi:hypothetical protein AUJ14_01880 [Candidatus Micrarchaeota archaeon CG1_02_55_22]|nr:MAG: hypothetical protein AUJ14_01880 [Candidatus Micrarchaeota archaeon CG1_02_55_22]